MEKLLSIRWICTKVDCQEIIAEFDILKEDKHSYRISMADDTGEVDERTLKKKWIGEITEYDIGEGGVEFKIICLPQDKMESRNLLMGVMVAYLARLQANLDALNASVHNFVLIKNA